jgi:hypothetical protein
VNAPRKLIVIVENGKVIGTQVVVAPPHAHAAATAVLSVGPGQTRFEIMAQAPDKFDSEHDIACFHASLYETIRKTL